MAKNIYQLAKLSRRTNRQIKDIESAVRKLDASPARTEHQERLLRQLVTDHKKARLRAWAIQNDAASRNTAGFAFRCALPLKRQRALGILPAVNS